MARAQCLIVILAALLFVLHDAAQATTIDVGVRGGVSIANFRGDNDVVSDYTSRTGFTAGVFASIWLNDWLAIQPEVLYSQKGGESPETPATDSEGNSAGTFSLIYKLNYLEIPLLATARVPTESGFSPFVTFGPVVGFEVSSKAELSRSFDWVRTNEFDVAGGGTDFGLMFGGGVSYVTNSLIFLLDVRYNLGLANTESEGPSTVKNETLSVSAGVGFTVSGN